MSDIASYPWVSAYPPRMVAEAVRLIGVRETVGAKDDPRIMGWAKEAGIAGYWADSVPWCGLFLAVVARRAGKAVPDKPLWALNWARFGRAAPQPALGDVLVFRRPSGGHVGLYVAEDATAFHVLGGNQGDRVCILRIAKARLHAMRRPLYRAEPASVRPYRMGTTTAALSTNEA
ncbi:TIGR02594 family protein [Sphingomonas naphthae]|uniref:TIGR02594 family protein n=1 Tax=Sphingomonas naphthae TaxID=1813468 RepID=A0ABY7THM8_9SPHN|nr:TIGR02594 family protein [Sphingomonas naphthae]WCT72383.1 TIGR02594 family protein [Sphingomonas naphthae]